MKTKMESGSAAVQTTSLLDELLNQTAVEQEDADAQRLARRGIEAFLSELLISGDKYEHVDRRAVDLMIAEVDEKLESQINEILHNKDFQKIESTWRGIKYLVEHCDFRENTKVHLLNADRETLQVDFEDAPDLTRSALYRKVYSAEYGTFGGQPYGALVSELTFGPSHDDLRLLGQLTSIAAMAHAPLLTNASPSFFGADDFHGLPKMRDLQAHFESPQFARWRSFRNNEDSRYVGLCCPRVMLRQPYGEGVNEVREFAFKEHVEDSHDKYLWGQTSFALAAVCAQSFAGSGWCNNIIGPTSGGAVRDLPLHQYDAMGKLQTKLPVEVQLTERREYELSEEGFVGLTFRKESDHAVFFSANSVQRAKTYGPSDKDSELNYRLGTQLPYMFLITRVAHYLKVLQRENLGTTQDKGTLELELRTWLGGLTTNNVASDAMAARFPFKDSSVEVEDVPGVAGWYRIKVQLVPHFKYMGADFTLSLVGKVDKSLPTDGFD